MRRHGRGHGDGRQLVGKVDDGQQSDVVAALADGDAIGEGGLCPSGSPPHIRAMACQMRSHARSGHWPQPSSTRPPRANQPIAGAVSPRNIRPDPTRPARRGGARIGASEGLVVSAGPRVAEPIAVSGAGVPARSGCTDARGLGPVPEQHQPVALATDSGDLERGLGDVAGRRCETAYETACSLATSARSPAQRAERTRSRATRPSPCT
jgi:hypothetical protein